MGLRKQLHKVNDMNNEPTLEQPGFWIATAYYYVMSEMMGFPAYSVVHDNSQFGTPDWADSAARFAFYPNCMQFQIRLYAVAYDSGSSLERADELMASAGALEALDSDIQSLMH